MKEHLTAIARKKLSTPVKFLNSMGLLTGRTLDFGCGRGFDSAFLGHESYDPYYQPIFPTGEFNTIYCVYVLNVIENPNDRKSVIESIRRLLKPSGKGYIAVRNDKEALKGQTSKGTWQGHIELDLPIVTANRNFVIYEVTSEESS
jgi:ATP adenylyltransferase